MLEQRQQDMHLFKPQNGPGESDGRNMSMFKEYRDKPFNRQRSHDSSGSEGRGNRQQEYDSRIFRRHSGTKHVEFEDEVMAQQKLQHNREAGHPYKRPQRRSHERDVEDELPFKGFNKNFGSFDGQRNERNEQRNRGGFGNRERRDRRDNYRDIRYQNEHDNRGFDQGDRRDNYQDNRDKRSSQRNEHDNRDFDQGDRRDNYRDKRSNPRNEHDNRDFDQGDRKDNYRGNRDNRSNQRNEHDNRDRRDRQENFRDNRQNQRSNYNDRYDRQNSWNNRRDDGKENRNQNHEPIVRSNSFGGGDRLAHSNSKQSNGGVTRSKSFRDKGHRNDENRGPPHDDRFRNVENEDDEKYVSYGLSSEILNWS